MDEEKCRRKKGTHVREVQTHVLSWHFFSSYIHKSHAHVYLKPFSIISTAVFLELGSKV